MYFLLFHVKTFLPSFLAFLKASSNFQVYALSEVKAFLALACVSENLGEKGFKLKFGDAFRIAKKDGKKVFTWKGKKYTTQTKAELEAGKSEKAKFERKRKSNVEAAKSKKGFFSKVKSALGGDKDWSPEAVEKRRMEKRVAWMKKRKNQGKSYSAKNLKELEAKLSQ